MPGLLTTLKPAMLATAAARAPAVSAAPAAAAAPAASAAPAAWAAAPAAWAATLSLQSLATKLEILIGRLRTWEPLQEQFPPHSLEQHLHPLHSLPQGPSLPSVLERLPAWLEDRKVSSSKKKAALLQQSVFPPAVGPELPAAEAP